LCNKAELYPGDLRLETCTRYIEYSEVDSHEKDSEGEFSTMNTIKGAINAKLALKIEKNVKKVY
jgi:hypothetical protein